MALVFHYAPMSSAVTIHWVLEELGVPYDKVKLDLSAGDTRKPPHLAINPNGKVPVIVHDGVAIFEAAAISIYLGETFGAAKKLFPEAGPRRGPAMSWIVWANVSLGEAWARVQHNSSPRIPAERHNAKALEAAREDVEKLLAVLDGAVAKSSYLLGDEFSIVDAHVASWTSFIGLMGYDFKKHTHLDAWNTRCTARPAFKIAMSP
ncbi:MAG TPA: glutathione S-transferase family protein [Kofleriaceae bacterium]|jgi:glutathione S-transferase|nr:glutathione S-transferase family protein [Kofleriaceae bacterium]